jgi:multidrug efflux pump
MPHAVAHSIDDFVEAVVESIGIVLIDSLLSLGARTACFSTERHQRQRC